jgi:hypothetical protein
MIGKAFLDNETPIKKLEKPRLYDLKKLIFKLGCQKECCVGKKYLKTRKQTKETWPEIRESLDIVRHI